MRIDELRPKPTTASAIEIPPELMDSVIRHQADLTQLLADLRTTGLADTLIEQSIRSLVDSYAAELTAAILNMKASHND